jgi:hypothetical protein
VYFSARGLGAIEAAAHSSASPSVLATALGNAFPLAAGGESLYFADTSGMIRKLVRSTRAVVSLGSAQGQVADLAVDGTSVYWSTYSDSPPYTEGRLLTMPLDGGTATAMVSGVPTMTKIAVDDEFVYWTSSGTAANKRLDGAVMKAAK